MTIESNLQSIADSLKIIADLLTVQTATKATTNATKVSTEIVSPTVTQTVSTPSPAPAPVPVQSVPSQAAANPTPVVQPVVADPVQNVMPPTPVFTPAAPTPTVPEASAAPDLAQVFPSKAAMMDWVMTAYRALGAEKGAKIQEVLVAMGYQNINDVPAEKWGQLKTGVEALK